MLSKFTSDGPLVLIDSKSAQVTKHRKYLLQIILLNILNRFNYKEKQCKLPERNALFLQENKIQCWLLSH